MICSAVTSVRIAPAWLDASTIGNTNLSDGHQFLERPTPSHGGCRGLRHRCDDALGRQRQIPHAHVEGIE